MNSDECEAAIDAKEDKEFWAKEAELKLLRELEAEVLSSFDMTGPSRIEKLRPILDKINAHRHKASK